MGASAPIPLNSSMNSYIQHLKFPRLPDEILSQVNFNLAEYDKKVDYEDKFNYVWTDSFNSIINEWCKENICETMYWGFQIISGDLIPHRDQGTLTKINYLLDAGGNSVVTGFYDDEQKLVYSEIIPEHTWHILKADVLHSVIGVERARFAITGRVF